MKALISLLLTVCVCVSGCQAKEPIGNSNLSSATQQSQAEASEPGLREEIYERARKRHGGKEPTRLELLNELILKGKEQAGAPKVDGKPRIVPKSAKPEVIIQGTRITINGKPVAIGDSIESWKRALPGKAACHHDTMRTMCVWDDLGIQLLTQSAKNQAVLDFTMYQNLELQPQWSEQLPDGSTIKSSPDNRPKNAFPGYLELDGYGIDAKTEFWEIRASADPRRNLRCNPRDCSHPHGGHDTKASLYLRLNGPTDRGTLYEFTVSANPE